jgi:hypothetical protein
MFSRHAFVRISLLAAILVSLAPGAARAHAIMHHSDPADGRPWMLHRTH